MERNGEFMFLLIGAALNFDDNLGLFFKLWYNNKKFTKNIIVVLCFDRLLLQ